MQELESRLAESWPPTRWRDVTVIAAVSGGPDSVALAVALAALRSPGGGRVAIAHYNHCLRGAESDADEQFVVDLAHQLECQCHVGRAAGNNTSPPAELADSNTSEEQSRDARYAFLTATAQQIGARYVATAHTADDQAETVLHRILRGTGLPGLAGMPRARELAPGLALVRPLLDVRRAEVRDYLVAKNQSSRVDRSNQDQRYTRNRLRQDLLPRLAAEYNPRIVEALLRLSAMASDAQQVIDSDAAALAEQCVLSSTPSRIVIDAARLEQVSNYLVRETLIAVWRAQGWPLQAMGAAQWELLALLASNRETPTSARHVLPGEILAERSGDELTLSRRG